MTQFGHRVLNGALALTLLLMSQNAIASKDKLAATLDEVGRTVEHAAVEFHKAGAGAKLIEAGANFEFPGSGTAIEALANELHEYRKKRERAKQQLDRVDTMLAASKGRSHGVREHVKKVSKTLEKSAKRLDAFRDEAKARHTQLTQSIQLLKAHRSKGQNADPSETLEARFAQLEKDYPHWSKDIRSIEKKHAKRITSLATGCKEGTASCRRTIQVDIDESTQRLGRYTDLITSLEKTYGNDVANAIGGYLSDHAEALLADIVAIATHYSQRANALHTKLDWMHGGLLAIEESCCQSH